MGTASRLPSALIGKPAPNTYKALDSLRAKGVEKGDRVGGFLPNCPEAVVAMLAASSLGAVWSSCSPDFGVEGVLDRFGQIAPRIVFCADGYYFKGKAIDSLERIADILDSMNQVAEGVHTARSVHDLAVTCHAHPTLAEALKEAALAVNNEAIHA